MSKIKGGDLMVFVEGVSVAFATSHTLSINADTTDTSNKDEGGGGWQSSEVNLLSWTATTENLYSEDGEGKGFDDLFDLMIAKEPVTLVFAKKSSSATDVPTGGWSAGTPKKTGEAIITALEANAPNGDNATFTCTFTGVGALTNVKT